MSTEFAAHALADPARAGAVRRLRRPGLVVDHFPTLVAPATAWAWFEALRREAAWTQPEVRVYGRRHRTPRLTAWYGDPGVRYRYSGVEHEALPWLALLAQIRDGLERLLEHDFNAVLMNFYRDGRDCVSWHSDDEPTLGRDPLVASLSLGEARRFRLRPRPPRGGAAGPAGLEAARPCELLLGHGSLLVMRGPTQHHWQHCLPRCATARPRLNLTFRAVRARG